VKWDPDKLDLRFVVMDSGGQSVNVHSTGAPPQMFRDGMGVVVEGRFQHGLFQATNLMVKHSNEYRAPKPGEEAHEKYKTLIQQSSK
jgi:cytochrome c-type biogenesis protein CcmE